MIVKIGAASLSDDMVAVHPASRRSVPKGTNLNAHSPERLAVAVKINARPRESRKPPTNDWPLADAHGAHYGTLRPGPPALRGQQVALQKGTDLLHRINRLWCRASKEVKHMLHFRHDLDLDLYPGSAGLLGKSPRVVEQTL